jgi:PEGA domain
MIFNIRFFISTIWVLFVFNSFSGFAYGVSSSVVIKDFINNYKIPSDKKVINIKYVGIGAKIHVVQGSSKVLHESHKVDVELLVIESGVKFHHLFRVWYFMSGGKLVFKKIVAPGEKMAKKRVPIDSSIAKDLDISVNPIGNTDKLLHMGGGFSGKKIPVGNFRGIEKLKRHKLKIDNSMGFSGGLLFSRNGEVKKKIGKGVTTLNLYGGTYYLRFEKPGYNDYFTTLNLNQNQDYTIRENKEKNQNQNQSYEIKKDREKELEFHQSISVASEYNYSSILGSVSNIGLSFNFPRDITNNWRSYDGKGGRKEEFSIISLGVKGDFFNKSYSVTGSFMPVKFYFFKGSPIYTQFGLFGLGDELEFLYKNDRWHMRGFFSLKIGANIELVYPHVDLNIYVKVGNEAQFVDENDEGEDGYYVGIGLSFVFNIGKHTTYSGGGSWLFLPK